MVKFQMFTKAESQKTLTYTQISSSFFPFFLLMILLKNTLRGNFELNSKLFETSCLHFCSNLGVSSPHRDPFKNQIGKQLDETFLPGCPGFLYQTRASSGAHLDLVGPLASRGGMHEAAMTQRAQESKGEEMKETKVCHLSGGLSWGKLAR